MSYDVLQTCSLETLGVCVHVTLQWRVCTPKAALVYVYVHLFFSPEESLLATEMKPSLEVPSWDLSITSLQEVCSALLDVCWFHVKYYYSVPRFSFYLPSPSLLPPPFPRSSLPSLLPPPFPPYFSSLPSLFLLSSLPIPPLFPPYSSSLIHTHTHTSQAVIGIEDNDLREEKLKELSTLVGVLSFPPPCYTRRRLYNIG